MGSSQSTPTHSGLVQYDNCLSCNPALTLDKMKNAPQGIYNKAPPVVPAEKIKAVYGNLATMGNQGDIWSLLSALNNVSMISIPFGATDIKASQNVVTISVCDVDPATRVVTVHNVLPIGGDRADIYKRENMRISLSGIAAKTKDPRQIILTRVKDQYGQGYMDAALTLLPKQIHETEIVLLLENKYIAYLMATPR